MESFNNVMNIFQDKRISFSDLQYSMRSQLAVLHWNENGDRAYTSIWNPRDARAPRRRLGKKVYKAVTYQYRQNIWGAYYDFNFCPTQEMEGKYMNRRNKIMFYSYMLVSKRQIMYNFNMIFWIKKLLA